MALFVVGSVSDEIQFYRQMVMVSLLAPFGAVLRWKELSTWSPRCTKLKQEATSSFVCIAVGCFCLKSIRSIHCTPNIWHPNPGVYFRERAGKATADATTGEKEWINVTVQICFVRCLTRLDYIYNIIHNRFDTVVPRQQRLEYLPLNLHENYWNYGLPHLRRSKPTYQPQLCPQHHW